MDKSIYKYQLRVTSEQNLILPKGSEILTVQNQFEQAELWALVDTETSEKEIRHIEIIGTGHPIDGNIQRRYISTFQIDGGNFILHAFERL